MGKKKSTINNFEQQKFEKFYSEWWDLDGPFKILHLFNYLRIDFIKRNFFERNEFYKKASLKNLKVLDIGCGGGILCESLARLGADVTGIDTSVHAINIAKKHAKNMHLNISYKKIDITEFQPKSKFDIITCMEVIEHVDNVDILLKNIKDIISHSGLFVGSTINKTILSYVGAIIIAENFLNLLPRGTHDWKKFVKISELKNLLIRSGFKYTNFQGIKYNPLLENWSYSNLKSINYLFCATG